MTPEYRTETYTRQNVNIRPDVVRSIVHNLSTRDVKVRIARKTGEEVKGIIEIINENRVHFTASEAVDGAIITIEGQVPVKRSPAIIAGEYFVRALMGIRSVSLSYTSSQGQFLPGYLPASKFLGMSNEDEMLAPGWPFVLGYNDRNFFDKAMNRGWITKDTMLNTPASYNNRFDLSARATIEPFPGMRIDVSADRRFQELASLYYVADRNGNFPDSTRNRNINGTFSISVISWVQPLKKYQRPTIMYLQLLKPLRKI
jgi:cell surface protein SprA